MVCGLQYTRVEFSSALRESGLFLSQSIYRRANCSTLARDHAIKISMKPGKKSLWRSS